MILFLTISLTIISIIYFTIIALILKGIFQLKGSENSPYDPTTRVSIIIPARNEESEIGGCLKSISVQDYPLNLINVVVVDDQSTDRTLEVIREFEQKNQSLHILILHAPVQTGDLAFKKHAIRAGVEASSGELIITTDADTRRGPSWVRSIVHFRHATGSEMILAPVCFPDEKTLFGRIQAVEFAGLMAATAGSCSAGFPLMCNGANLTFTRNAWESAENINNDLRFPSGDDLFLMMSVMKTFGRRAVGFLYSPHAVVTTPAKASIGEFISQRLRWVSKSRGYTDPVIKGTAVITWLFSFILLSGFVAGFFNIRLLIFCFFISGCKSVLEYPAVHRILGLSDTKTSFPLFLAVQLLNMFYVVAIGLLGNFIPYTWKGRVINTSHFTRRT